MRYRYIPNVLAVAALAAYLTSGMGSAAPEGRQASPPDIADSSLPAEIRERIRNERLADDQIEQIVDEGPRVLDSIIDDFIQSSFVHELRGGLTKDSNPGRQLDENAHANNVIRIAEAFGQAGVETLIDRLDPELIGAAQLQSDAFKRLGPGTIKPLLTMEMLLHTPEKDLPALREWMSSFVDERDLVEVGNLPPPRAFPFLAAVAASVAGAALWEGGKAIFEYAQEGENREEGAEAYHEYWTESNPVFLRPRSSDIDQLSEAERKKKALRRLDPR